MGWRQFFVDAFHCIEKQLDLAPPEFLGMGDNLAEGLSGSSEGLEWGDSRTKRGGAAEVDISTGGEDDEDGEEEEQQRARQRAAAAGRERDDNTVNSAHFVSRALDGLSRCLREDGTAADAPGGEAPAAASGIHPRVRSSAESLLAKASSRFEWRPPVARELHASVRSGAAGGSGVTDEDLASVIAQLRLSGAIGDDDEAPAFVIA